MLGLVVLIVPPGQGDCTFDGVVYRNLETFEDPADRCLVCMCNMGEVMCGQPGVQCPPIDCPLPVVPEGECCPICEEGTRAKAPPRPKPPGNLISRIPL